MASERGEVMATIKVEIESIGESCGQCEHRMFRRCNLFHASVGFDGDGHPGHRLIPMRCGECLDAEIEEPTLGKVMGAK